MSPVRPAVRGRRLSAMNVRDEQANPASHPPADQVLAAFKQARERGKQDWWRMTTPVLKNRMLQLDPRGLEDLVGNQTFRAWVEAQPSLTITPDGKHAIVELPEHLRRLIENESQTEAVGDAMIDWRAVRVRPDLWRAVIDHDSERRYVWDAESQRAVHATAQDGRPVLPSLTPDDMRSLRASFAGSVRGTDLSEWVATPGSTEDLPRRHRGLWNEVVKKEVIKRLTSWFSDQGLVVPDITQQTDIHVRDANDATARDLLRALATDMRPAELQQVTVPLSAVARLLSGK